jgi:signal transduction histidine kinase
MKWLGSEKNSPVVPLGLCIVLTVSLFTLGAGITTKLYAGIQELATTELRLATLNGVIVHIDEVLTMSARMGAQTGDAMWEVRYRAYEKQLDAALAEVQVIAPGALSAQATAKTDAANRALVEIENRAFAWVREGNPQEAVLAFNATYEERKRVYAEGMRDTMTAARNRIEEQIEERTFWGSLFVSVAAVVLVVLMGLWARLFAIARRYVNARVRAEAELKAAHDTLEVRVGERTQDLQVANAQLGTALQRERETRDQLMQASKLAAVGQLAAGVSHEINNPLAVILGFAQGLERRVPASDPNRLPVTSIVREALRCKALVQELLTFSRTAKTTVEHVDVNALITSSVVLLEARARTQGVQVVTELCADLVSVNANKIQLQQVLVNLGTNAFDAMAAGGALTLRTRKEDGENVVLEVVDTGIGIPEAVRARIFEPFFSTKEVGKGTGLGLSLVHEIVQQHKGTIEVSSEEGKGTMMRIRLPARQLKKAAA